MPVSIWSIVCPWFWEVKEPGWAASLSVGGLLVGRVLFLRSVSADKATWKVWCLWTATLYVLRLFKKPNVLVRYWETCNVERLLRF